jgi:hypothetical protein
MILKNTILLISPILCAWEHMREGTKRYVHNSAEFDIEFFRPFDESTYALDPVNEMDEKLSSGQDVIDKNQAWLARAGSNDEQFDFVTKIINTFSSLVVTPYQQDLTDNDYDYCYVILAYNSDIPKMYDELSKLADGLSKYYIDRCNLGVLDLGYPSNMATFGHLFDELPSLLIKRPSGGHITKEVDKNTRDLEFNDLETFGYILGYTKIVTNLMEELLKIDEMQKKETPEMEKFIIGLQDHLIRYSSGARHYCREELRERIEHERWAKNIPDDADIRDADVLRGMMYCKTCKGRDNPLANAILECSIEVTSVQTYEERKVPGVSNGFQYFKPYLSYTIKSLLSDWLEKHEIDCKNGVCQATKSINDGPKFFDYTNDAKKIYREPVRDEL